VRAVAASCIAIRDGALFVDPSKEEEERADGVVTFVYTRETGEVFGSFFEGSSILH
jgi:ribonuclease PH